MPQPEVEADESNPRGYYEPLWVTEFHKELLNPHPGAHHRLPPDRRREGRGGGRRPEVEERLRDWLSGQLDHPQVVIKDPREFWVHELWLRVAGELGAEVTTLTMLRHPTEVVRSRDTAYLTEQTRRASAGSARPPTSRRGSTRRSRPSATTRGHRRAFVPYADLIADWRAAMAPGGGAARDHATATPTAPHPVDDFIDARLNRSQVTWDDLEVAPQLRDLAEPHLDRDGRARRAARTTRARSPSWRGMREEYVEMYEFAAAMALDEQTAQVAQVRRNLTRRIENKQKRIDALKEQLRSR